MIAPHARHRVSAVRANGAVQGRSHHALSILRG
jgi:hypothetical protein